MKKLLLVMNPCAGKRKANHHLTEIIDIFNRHGWEPVVHMTAAQGDGVQIVKDRARDVDLVVAVGGDGTFNEAVSGLLAAGADTPIGYIPAGSTNDFASSLHLPTNIPQAAMAIMEGAPVSYDIGRFGDRYFSYVASFGAFTRTSYATPQSVKNALGHLAYVLGSVRELSSIRKEHLRIETETETFEGDYIFGAVSNSTSVGGILTLDPKIVDMADGKFELLLIRAPHDIIELGDCVRALTTQKYNCKMITFASAGHLRVSPRPDMAWTLDGEKAEGAEVIEIQNLHHAIRLVQKA